MLSGGQDDLHRQTGMVSSAVYRSMVTGAKYTKKGKERERDGVQEGCHACILERTGLGTYSEDDKTRSHNCFCKMTVGGWHAGSIEYHTRLPHYQLCNHDGTRIPLDHSLTPYLSIPLPRGYY